MKLLILANNFDIPTQRFENYFEEVEKKALTDLLIDTGGKVLVEGEKIEDWDSLYIEPEPKAFNYLRVLLETIEHKDINCNLDPSSIFLQGKKPFLFSVLADRGIDIPTQVSVSTEKGLTEIERDLDFPVVAKKYSSFELSETKIFKEFKELKAFSELSEHGKDYIMIQEYSDEDMFDILYVNGNMISLKLEESSWKVGEAETVSKKYHSISTGQKGTVEEAVNAMGSKICLVRLNGDKVVDIQNNPDLEEFKEKSGKNVYGRIADVLKGGGDA